MNNKYINIIVYDAYPTSIQQFLVKKPILPCFDASSTGIRKVTSFSGKTFQPSSASQPSSTSQPSSASQSSSSSTQKVKKKQAVLDNLFLIRNESLPNKVKMKGSNTSRTTEETLQQLTVTKGKYPKPDSTTSFPTDIANYVSVTLLTDEQKYHALCNVWVGTHNTPFPLGNDNRKFRFE